MLELASMFGIYVKVIQFFICFQEKRTGVLANASADCDLFFTTVRNSKLHCVCFPSRMSYIHVLLFLDVPYFCLSKLKTSVSHQPLNLEHGSDVLFRKVIFKPRLWSRNPALLGLQARWTTMLIGWWCCIWISAGYSCAQLHSQAQGAHCEHGPTSGPFQP